MARRSGQRCYYTEADKQESLIANNDKSFDAHSAREKKEYFVGSRLTETTHRDPGPRRPQRRLVILTVTVIAVTLALMATMAWRIAPSTRYHAYWKELASIDATSGAASARHRHHHHHHSKGMIHLKTMDERHLPHKHRRLVVVGDVHGCKDELKALLEKVNFVKGDDHLVLAGDIINKGPDSRGVVSLAHKVGASCVRGNHEDHVLLTAAKMQESKGASVEAPPAGEPPDDAPEEILLSPKDRDLRKLVKQLGNEQLDWLSQCPVILRVGKIHDLGEVVVVHAGLVAGVPLEKQDPYDVMNMRTIDPKTRIPSAKRDGTPWEKLWNHHQKTLPHSERMTVVYGHNKKRGKNIQKFSMGLDSGCVGGGHLTAMVIGADGKHEFVQVRCKKDYTA